MKFEDVLAARIKLAEARVELRKLAEQCETERDWHMVAGGFYGNHKPGSAITNAQVWCLLGLNAPHAHLILHRVQGEGRVTSDWWNSPEFQQLKDLEDRFAPWGEDEEAEAA